MKNDFDIVYQAVKNHGQSLNYASYELRNNETIVLQAIYQDGSSF